MKGVIALCLAAAMPFTLAVNTNTTETFALLSTLPSCALTCLTTSVANSTCSPTDTLCVCTNAPLTVAIESCVQSTCTIKQSLTTKNVTSTVCEAPIRDARPLYNNLAITLGVLSAVAAVLRLYSRYISTQKFGFDDYSIVLVMVIGIPSTVMIPEGLTYNGLGLDIWRVGFRQITDFIHIFFVMEILYFGQVGVIKLSILFFYLRLFPGPAIRKWIWGTIYFNIVFTTVFVFAGLFQCNPISYYWKNWDLEHKGTCMNINALAWANAGISIALDVWMLVLPLTQLAGLKLHWKKKLGVAAMFSVGGFITIVSIIRLQTLVKFSNTHNPTWDYIAVGCWSDIEINVGIICACMPNIRLLLVRAFPRVMGTTHDRSYGYGYASGAGGGGGGQRSKIPASGTTASGTGNRNGNGNGNGTGGYGGGSALRSANGRGEVASKAPNDEEDLSRTSTIELVTVQGNRKGDDGVWV